jgi:hypothetical protein
LVRPPPVSKRGPLERPMRRKRRRDRRVPRGLRPPRTGPLGGQTGRQMPQSCRREASMERRKPRRGQPGALKEHRRLQRGPPEESRVHRRPQMDRQGAPKERRRPRRGQPEEPRVHRRPQTGPPGPQERRVLVRTHGLRIRREPARRQAEAQMDPDPVLAGSPVRGPGRSYRTQWPAGRMWQTDPGGPRACRPGRRKARTDRDHCREWG